MIKLREDREKRQIEQSDLSMESSMDSILLSSDSKFIELMAKISPSLSFSLEFKVQLELLASLLQKDGESRIYYLAHLSYLRRLIATDHEQITPLVKEVNILDIISPSFQV
jgi:hypothetical protein